MYFPDSCFEILRDFKHKKGRLMLECCIFGEESINLPLFDALNSNQKAVINYALKNKKMNTRGWTRVKVIHDKIKRSKDDKLLVNIGRRVNVKAREKLTDEDGHIKGDGNEKVR